jgi:hypothetical protein
LLNGTSAIVLAEGGDRLTDNDGCSLCDLSNFLILLHNLLDPRLRMHVDVRILFQIVVGTHTVGNFDAIAFLPFIALESRWMGQAEKVGMLREMSLWLPAKQLGDG